MIPSDFIQTFDTLQFLIENTSKLHRELFDSVIDLKYEMKNSGFDSD